MSSPEVRLEQAQSTLERAEKKIEEQLRLIEQLAACGQQTGPAERRLVDRINRISKLTLHRDSLERATSNSSARQGV